MLFINYVLVRVSTYRNNVKRMVGWVTSSHHYNFSLLQQSKLSSLFTAPPQKLSSNSSHAEARQIPRGLHLGPHSILSTHYVLQIPALDAEVEGISKRRAIKFMGQSARESLVRRQH